MRGISIYFRINTYILTDIFRKEETNDLYFTIRKITTFKIITFFPFHMCASNHDILGPISAPLKPRLNNVYKRK